MKLTKNIFTPCNVAICLWLGLSVWASHSALAQSPTCDPATLQQLLANPVCGPIAQFGLCYKGDNFISVTPANANSKRTQVIQFIWGTTTIPVFPNGDVTPTTLTGGNIPYNLVNLGSAQKLAIHMQYSGKPAVAGLAHYFRASLNRKNRLVIINPGHACTFDSLDRDHYGVLTTINALLVRGYDVLGVYMPRQNYPPGEADCIGNHCGLFESGFLPDANNRGSGLRYFLEPTVKSLAYVLSQQGNSVYESNGIVMIGLSGGGWTTNLYAAIDPRVRHSFDIAGSLPLHLRQGTSFGDFEQYIPQLYLHTMDANSQILPPVATYLDLYVLGSVGAGRKQVQVLNRRDSCCFGQNAAQYHNPATYDSDLIAYKNQVVSALQGAGSFDLKIDERSTAHMISAETLIKTILTELGEPLDNEVAIVSAASFNPIHLADSSIASLFGSALSSTTVSATSQPLPTTLAGTQVFIKDILGVERAAPLFFVSPGQINLQVPQGTASGLASIRVTINNGQTTKKGVCVVHQLAPSLFTANVNGSGVASAQVLRVKTNGAQVFEPVAVFNPAQNQFVALPIALGQPDDLQFFLVLYGTGIRGHSSSTSPPNPAIVATAIGGVGCTVTYAGQQPGSVGLDQVNVLLPNSLIGRGEVDVVLVANNKVANTVKITIQ